MIIIAFFGGTGSGKTTIVNQIVTKFDPKFVQLISQDAYYKDNSEISFEARCLLNYDHPQAIDFDLLYKHLKLLKEGFDIQRPVYDFKTHNRTGETVLISPKKILILEGILIMNDAKLRRLFDFKIFIDAKSEIRMERRINRDILERGRTPKQVMDRYLNTLKPMHQKFIEPMKIHADLIIENHSNDATNLDEIQSIIRTTIYEK